MNEIHLLLLLHLLGATIWVGGHILLSVIILPQVWKEKSVEKLFAFESRYEWIGMPALAVMLITGVRMAYLYNVRITTWFAFKTPIETVISLKLLCLFSLVLFALSAQCFVLPRLKTNIEKLPLMAFHILSVTCISIVMLVLGSFVRYGGISL
ncbi:CopD family protein [Myroides sp. 1354]|uniref:CopD family protein n=1 Tax=unclassified Myroides TaxID=2642485 RepID=UPI002577A8FF|nr:MULTISPECIES: CopD family protein [unclassified Myroides]MDM1045357.1 CopD family protein [Myroides sp. R163-1]MDM1056406.1 CopD family protein [Myroides sp. 1354]MDM1069488.1 CopD family protein [Myroides sp. 1372]